MECINVAGSQLSSMAIGEGSPVVMLHGLATGNMSSWFSTIASPLSNRNKVVLYDQRGHGGSTVASSGYDLQTQLDDLQAVLAGHGLADEAVDLVGFSMGAVIALHFALRFPKQVKRLVLIDAPLPVSDYVAPSLSSVPSPEALAEFIRTELLPTGVPSGRRGRRMLERLSALFFESTLVSDVQAMLPESDELLATLEPPVLLVYGEKSPCVSVGHRLQRVLPQAQLKLIDCGHYIPDDAPEPLKQHIEQFLQQAA